MERRQLDSLTFDWGAVTTYRPGLRSFELVARVRWFIKMRWIAVAACVAGALAASIDWPSFALSPFHFALDAGFLGLTNLSYTLLSRRLLEREDHHHPIHTLLLVQMFGDFLALGFLSYTCGTIETPLLTLFLAHIILATLFFNRGIALIVIFGAWVFASLPLALEWAGWIPVISIFDSSFKHSVVDDDLVTGGFITGIGSVFFTCWYLVSEISSSLKLRERQLEEAYELLVKLSREKTQATLRATHELKAPFAAIKSYVYTLRDGYCGPLPEKAGKVVSRIGDRCDQLTEKITDIIHLGNLKTLVVTEMNLVPVELSKLLFQEIEEGALLGELRGTVVENQIEGERSVHILGSAPHLHTMFKNLIQNAVRYSRDQGRVVVSMKRKAKRVSVRVRDQGIGIPQENLERIFDEHFRSNNAVAHHPNGTGLGLPLVKEIVRLHDAVIHVKSELGAGTHFTVSFETIEPKKYGGKHGEDPHHRR